MRALENILKPLASLKNNNIFQIGFDQSIESLPALPLFFLESKNLYDWRDFCGLPECLDNELVLVASIISKYPDLNLLAWHTYRRMYAIPDDKTQFDEWPDLNALLGDKEGLFYLIIALAMVPHVKLAHEKISVSMKVTIDTCQQINHFADNYRREKPGQWGILRKQLYWLRHYPRTQIFRLGRFEYKIEKKNINVRVIRNRQSGQIISLARDGLRLDINGYIQANESPIENGEFISILKEDGVNIIGHSISHTLGSVSNSIMTFPLSEWEIILWKGDWVLDLHIPAGGKMTLELCADSFKKAFEFFDHYFPDKLAKAVVCHSWVFSPILNKILPPNSNLVKLQNNVCLYPVVKNSRDGFFFLFGVDGETTKFSDLPKETSLQKSIVDYIMKNKPWFGGGMFLLRESVGNISKVNLNN